MKPSDPSADAQRIGEIRAFPAEELDALCHCGQYPEGDWSFATKCPVIEHRARSGAKWRTAYLEILQRVAQAEQERGRLVSVIASRDTDWTNLSRRYDDLLREKRAVDAALAAARQEVADCHAAFDGIGALRSDGAGELTLTGRAWDLSNRAATSQQEAPELHRAAQFVHDTFVKDEYQGYQSKDRQFAIAILGKALKAGADLAAARLRGREAREPDYRLCGYCNVWATKPCGEQCVWNPQGEQTPTATTERETLIAARDLAERRLATSEECRNNLAAEVARLSSQLAGMREAIMPLAEAEHWRAVSANALFSVEHWKHNAGPDWPHEPDNDSFTAFENCKHPLCAALHAAQGSPKEKLDAPDSELVERLEANASYLAGLQFRKAGPLRKHETVDLEMLLRDAADALRSDGRMKLTEPQTVAAQGSPTDGS